MDLPTRSPTEGNNRRTCQSAKRQLVILSPHFDKTVPFADAQKAPAPFGADSKGIALRNFPVTIRIGGSPVCSVAKTDPDRVKTLRHNSRKLC